MSLLQEDNLNTNRIESMDIQATNLSSTSLITPNLTTGSGSFQNVQVNDTLTANNLFTSELTLPANSYNVVNVTNDLITQGTLAITATNSDTLNVTNLIGVDDLETSDTFSDTINTASLNVQNLITDLLLSNTITSTNTNIKITDPSRVVSYAIDQLIIGSSVAGYGFSSTKPVNLTDMELEDPETPTTKNQTLVITNDVMTDIPVVNIFGYNKTINALDDAALFSGGQAVLSLCSKINPYRTLRFEQDGNLSIYGNTTTVLWTSGTSVSDIRTKKDIEPIVIKDSIKNLKGYTYTYDQDKFPFLPSGDYCGILAEDALEEFPECVKQNVDSNYIFLEKLVPLLVEYVKYLKKRNDMIKDKWNLPQK